MKNTTIIGLTLFAVIAPTIFIPANAAFATIGFVLGIVGPILGVVASIVTIRSNKPTHKPNKKRKSRRFQMKIEIELR